MQYELINPSDPYTFLADNKEIAALTVFCLSTQYGAQSQDETVEIPIFLFGGAKEWYQNEFGRTPDDGLEIKKRMLQMLCYLLCMGILRIDVDTILHLRLLQFISAKSPLL